MGLFLQLPEKMRADSPTPKRRQKGDVHDPDLILPMIDVKTACGLFFDLNDEELRGGVMLAVMRILRVKLLGTEGGFLLIAPASRSQFRLAGAGIDGLQKGLIVTVGDA